MNLLFVLFVNFCCYFRSVQISSKLRSFRQENAKENVPAHSAKVL